MKEIQSAVVQTTRNVRYLKPPGLAFRASAIQRLIATSTLALCLSVAAPFENSEAQVPGNETELDAQREIESCERDDFMLNTARSLVKAAIDAYMQLHNIDRQAAHDWIREAAD